MRYMKDIIVAYELNKEKLNGKYHYNLLSERMKNRETDKHEKKYHNDISLFFLDMYQRIFSVRLPIDF